MVGIQIDEYLTPPAYRINTDPSYPHKTLATFQIDEVELERLRRAESEWHRAQKLLRELFYTVMAW